MKIAALLLALALLTGCAAPAAYIPTGDGLADVTRPSAHPSEPEIAAPGGLQNAEGGYTLAYSPMDSFNPYDCTNIDNRMLFSLLYQSLFTVDSACRVEPQLCQSFTVSEEAEGITKVSMVARGIRMVEMRIQGRYFFPLLNLIESNITPNSVSFTASQTFTTSITAADLIGSIPKNKR